MSRMCSASDISEPKLFAEGLCPTPGSARFVQHSWVPASTAVGVPGIDQHAARVDACVTEDRTGGLTGDLGDQVEVGVVVQDGELFDVRDDGQHEIRHAHSAVTPPGDQVALQLPGSFFGEYGHRFVIGTPRSTASLQ